MNEKEGAILGRPGSEDIRGRETKEKILTSERGQRKPQQLTALWKAASASITSKPEPSRKKEKEKEDAKGAFKPAATGLQLRRNKTVDAVAGEPAKMKKGTAPRRDGAPSYEPPDAMKAWPDAMNPFWDWSQDQGSGGSFDSGTGNDNFPSPQL